ncbi:mechanosensitive ion channel family protein [[Mycobacterium] burgundiense]|uniref:Mechanosensitive ion channel family protein n=1 Tax=[Mycobacterium] burgundiense TaxID=3064286 RepID=A0ABM9LZ20_9MYCO|nr:mechanosensitive ion channel family protein [Mycolicibacterium sp. MU0053]CAJ1507161.1 mechanosensitive ion channel family protein [Mycolicibacterium sp. MU0053]
MTDTAGASVLAFDWAQKWHNFWHGTVGEWILAKGLQIVLMVLGALLAARFIGWASRKVTRRLEEGFQAGDGLVRSEASKHRQAVASVISWVAIVMLSVIVAVQITNVLDIPVGSLVAPAAVLGAAIGFGAQKVVQDLLAGFFIITERQYGFGDLVELNMLGAAEGAVGTVEEVTLRVTKLRTSDGEVFTVPNGNIVRSLNMSKDWARAVIDIPVPVAADINRVNEVLHQVGSASLEDRYLKDLLLDEPSLMGVESIGIDNVNLRMVARTLPGKQYEVGRRLRALVVRALSQEGVVTATGADPVVDTLPSAAGAKRDEKQGSDGGR